MALFEENKRYNLKFKMSKGMQLEQKLRKSEALTQQDIYHDFMAYAKEVRDQLEIYIYMQENSIGTNSTEYWLARFEVMRQRCLFSALADLIPKVKKIPEVQIDVIETFEKKLVKDLQRIICYPVSGRRKASSFFLQQIKHPEKRKIGNFEVFVDQECRKNYYLSDYARFVEDQKKEHCQIEQESYKRLQSLKPPSFLAKNQLHLIELAQQLLSKSARLSLNNRNSLGNQRMSTKINANRRQTFKEEDYNTPKCHTNSNLPKCSTSKANRDTSRDSVQILKQIRQKRLLDHRSPKFNEKEQRELENVQPRKDPVQENKIQNIAMERCRNAKQTEGQDFCFSFRNCKVVMSQQKQQKKRSVDDETKDNAFIAYSFSKQPNLLQKGNLDFLNREDFQLALLINEIQQEKYEKFQSKTFSSQIDSNQQNKFYNTVLRLHNPQGQILQDSPLGLNQQYIDNYDLQDLMRESEKYLQNQDYKAREMEYQSQQKGKLSPAYSFRSQQKRLSNISEQASYCSESRRKHYTKK